LAALFAPISALPPTYSRLRKSQYLKRIQPAARPATDRK